MSKYQTLFKLYESCNTIARYEVTIDIGTHGVITHKLSKIKEFQKQIHAPGIYFLLLKEAVVYVGQSVAPCNRIRQHTLSKVFDEVKFLPIAEIDWELDEIEILYIRLFYPFYNKRDKPRDSVIFNKNTPDYYKETLSRMRSFLAPYYYMELYNRYKMRYIPSRTWEEVRYINHQDRKRMFA